MKLSNTSSRIAVLGFTLGLAGCFSPAERELMCSANRSCPPGQSCGGDGLCTKDTSGSTADDGERLFDEFNSDSRQPFAVTETPGGFVVLGQREDRLWFYDSTESFAPVDTQVSIPGSLRSLEILPNGGEFVVVAASEVDEIPALYSAQLDATGVAMDANQPLLLGGTSSDMIEDSISAALLEGGALLGVIWQDEIDGFRDTQYCAYSTGVDALPNCKSLTAPLDVHADYQSRGLSEVGGILYAPWGVHSESRTNITAISPDLTGTEPVTTTPLPGAFLLTDSIAAGDQLVITGIDKDTHRGQVIVASPTKPDFPKSAPIEFDLGPGTDQYRPQAASRTTVDDTTTTEVGITWQVNRIDGVVDLYFTRLTLDDTEESVPVLDEQALRVTRRIPHFVRDHHIVATDDGFAAIWSDIDGLDENGFAIYFTEL